MRVGLIGAPGTGKSRVAHEIANEFGFAVIDDYVAEIEEQSDLELGYAADFLPNALVPAERWKMERRLEDDFVTCGTHIESVCYAALWAADCARLFPERRDNIMYEAQIATNAMSLYITKAWVYDSVFYLPLGDNRGDEFDKRLDFSIRDALAMLSIDHIVLDSEDPETQAVDALKEKHEAANTTE